MDVVKQIFGHPATKSDEDETHLQIILAHKSLSDIPQGLILGENTVTVLDLSNNLICNVHFLTRFKNLKILVLDNNRVNCQVIFPKLCKLQTLWLNRNKIEEVCDFVVSLSQQCPSLQVLSLMDNKGVPCRKSTNNLRAITLYRYYVVNQLSTLIYLDDATVTPEEKKNAEHAFGEANVVGFFRSKYLKLAEIVNRLQRINGVV